MKCIRKYVSKSSLPQYGVCIVCCAERDQVRGRVVGFVNYVKIRMHGEKIKIYIYLFSVDEVSNTESDGTMQGEERLPFG